MKKFGTFLFACLVLFSNCKNEKKEKSSSHDLPLKTETSATEYKSGIINTLSCSKNPSVEYALYLPKNYDKQKKFPIIFFFDAHARGKKPLKMYSQLADKYEFIFVGSNNSKNGLDNQTLHEIISSTMNDALEKFSIDPEQIYTSGFSGGAKVASIAAFGSPQIKGVIACAADMPEELLSKPLSFDYIGIAGLEDFNYMSLAIQDLKLKNKNHDLFVFKGAHEWAPTNIMDKAIRKIITNSMESGRRTKDETFIIETNKLLKDSLMHTNYNSQQQEQEEKLQQQYLQALNEKDLTWWVKEVERGNKETDEKGMMYKRTFAYMSMVCYTYTVKSLTQNRPDLTNKFVSIYQIVDPTNSDACYFRAILFAMQGKNQEALDILKKSAELGFSDIEKLQNEIAFKNIQNNPTFDEIIEKVSENSNK